MRKIIHLTTTYALPFENFSKAGSWTLQDFASNSTSDEKMRLVAEIKNKVGLIVSIHLSYADKVISLSNSFKQSRVWNEQELDESRFIGEAISKSIVYLNGYRLLAQSLTSSQSQPRSLNEWERVRDDLVDYIDIQLKNAQLMCLVMSNPYENDYEETAKIVFNSVDN